MDHQAEYDRIKAIIADLESSGMTIYKIALTLGQQYNTVKHWKSTGRVQSHDAKALESLRRQFAAESCQIEPQYCKVLTTST